MLEATLAKTSNWINANLALFSLKRSANTTDQIRLIKPLSELILVCSVLHEKKTSLDTSSILQFCWNELDSGQYLLRLFLARPDILELVGVCASFERCGFSTGRVRKVIEVSLEGKGEWAGNLPVWRRLAILHGLHILGLQEFPSTPPYGSFLSDLPPPWIISDDMAYALTHEIFYFTDFGNSRSPFPIELREYLEFCIPVWTEIFLEEKNFDLVSELIICAKCLDLPPPNDSVELLIDHQGRDGSFAGPPGAGRDIPSSGKPEKRFVSRYHTTLVSLLALAL